MNALEPPRKTYRAPFCAPLEHRWTGVVDGSEVCTRCTMARWPEEDLPWCNCYAFADCDGGSREVRCRLERGKP